MLWMDRKGGDLLPSGNQASDEDARDDLSSHRIGRTESRLEERGSGSTGETRTAFVTASEFARRESVMVI
ncbi:unnamed protein product [Sphagnum balticum]